jgi:hypothetical protein
VQTPPNPNVDLFLIPTIESTSPSNSFSNQIVNFSSLYKLKILLVSCAESVIPAYRLSWNFYVIILVIELDFMGESES